jgi:anti-anti-sigma regulatory factor
MPCTSADLLETLRGALNRLENAGGELILDFSAVRHLDAEGLKLMEELAACAGENHVVISLEAVSVDVYRVLKLAQVAPRFHFSL